MGAVAAATYGMNPLFTLPLYKEGMNPDSVLFFRYLFAIPILGIMLKARGRSFSLKRKEILPLVILGWLVAISSLTLFQSYNYMAVRRSRRDQSPSLLGKDVLTVCRMADVVFLALHGSCGEDGRIQATLDLLGVPYTGSGYLGSGMAMDKSVTKRMMDSLGIRTAPWHDIHYTESDIPRLAEELPVPCAVKIVNGGSSIGVALPDTKEQLEKALRDLLRYGDHVVVEQKIKGREIQIAVLGDGYLPAVEIIPKGAYFDYESKYQAGGAVELCPAPITDAAWKQVGEMALKLHKGLGLSVYSRSDFILDENGQAWCLEINTLPGMTPTSLVPQEAAQVGLSYGDLCQRIVDESLALRKGGRA